MGVHVRENRGKLYLDIYHKGRRVWESLGLTVPKDPKLRKEAFRLADIARVKREQMIFSGEWGLIDPVLSKQTFDEYAAKLAEKKRPTDHLPKVLPYLRAFSKGIAIHQVDAHFLDGFKDFLLSQERLGQTSAAEYFSAVCHVLKIAERDRIITKNPAILVKKISVPESDKAFLTEEELSKLADTPLGGELGGEIKQAFIFACMTGLRLSDIKALRWKDITRGKEPSMKVRQQKTKGMVTVPLNPTAWGIIEPGNVFKQPSDAVFPKLATTSSQPYRYLTRWAQAAGIEKKFGFHTSRHTFATLSIKHGAGIFTVQKLLGHSNSKMTEVYAKMTDATMREAVDSLPAIKTKRRA